MNYKDILRIDAPTIFVIFGATGDLGRKKLIPALFDLYCKDILPSDFSIYSFSRRDLDDDGFRAYLKDILRSTNSSYQTSRIESFAEKVFYSRGRFEEKKDYQTLKGRLDENETRSGVCMNKLYHLAVPPDKVEKIIKNLAKGGLTEACSDYMGWTRVLVEKPFGKDIQTARKLDYMLGSLFKEIQIFRIDHYLAKQTLQNILFFRFSNLIFEPVWNNRYIEKVSIRLLEKDGIGTRGNFYDGVGALRDVGQNHILQMLSLIAMENPGSLESSTVRKERAEVIKSLLCIEKDRITDCVVRGQYNGYKEEDGVDKDSDTETYFKIKAYIDNKRWKRVPFLLESGKALKEKKTDITIFFKPTTPCLCPDTGQQNHNNRITFVIQPEEEIHLRFLAKKQGVLRAIEPKDLSFDYGFGKFINIGDYENIILDCMKGDQTLFASTDEIRFSWEFITPLISNWDNLGLGTYEKGSDGPSVTY